MEFESLKAYQKAVHAYHIIDDKVLLCKDIKPSTRDQLQRASQSIVLNIAEGSSRPTFKAKNYFYNISRGSSYECSAILDLISNKIEKSLYTYLKQLFEEISKILYALIKKNEEKDKSNFDFNGNIFIDRRFQ